MQKRIATAILGRAMSQEGKPPFGYESEDQMGRALGTGSKLYDELIRLETPVDLARTAEQLPLRDLRCLVLERIWRHHNQKMSWEEFSAWQKKGRDEFFS